MDGVARPLPMAPHISGMVLWLLRQSVSLLRWIIYDNDSLSHHSCVPLKTSGSRRPRSTPSRPFSNSYPRLDRRGLSSVYALRVRLLYRKMYDRCTLVQTVGCRDNRSYTMPRDFTRKVCKVGSGPEWCELKFHTRIDFNIGMPLTLLHRTLKLAFRKYNPEEESGGSASNIKARPDPSEVVVPVDACTISTTPDGSSREEPSNAPTRPDTSSLPVETTAFISLAQSSGNDHT